MIDMRFGEMRIFVKSRNFIRTKGMGIFKINLSMNSFKEKTMNNKYINVMNKTAV